MSNDQDESRSLLSERENHDPISHVVIEMEPTRTKSHNGDIATASGSGISEEHEISSTKHSVEDLLNLTDNKDRLNMLIQPLPDAFVDEPINKLNSSLLDAIFNQNNVEVKRLLTMGASPNATCCKRNISAVHVAAYTNSAALAILLTKPYNAIKYRKDENGSTPLHYAAYGGNNQSIAMLLDFPTELQEKMKSEMTREIMELIPQISSIIIDVSCKRKAFVAVQDSWRDSVKHNCSNYMINATGFPSGWTPLHAASFAGRHNSTRLLLAAGANPDLKDFKENTPLGIVGMACLIGNRPLKIPKDSYVKTIKSLLEFGKKFESLRELNQAVSAAKTIDCSEAIHTLLLAGTPIDGISPLRNQILQLLGHRIHPRQPLSTLGLIDADGYNVLQRAVLDSWPQGVRIALNAGADVFHQANDGNTAIHLAALKGNLEILNQILDRFDNNVSAINSKNYRDETALICAIRSGKLDCVQAIIKKGASLEFTHVSAHSRLPEDEMKQFLSGHSKGHPLKLREWEIIKQNTKVHNSIIFHAVWMTTEAEYIKILEFLLNHDNSLKELLDYGCPDLKNMIPVEIAALENKSQIFKFLLQKTVERAIEASRNFNPPILWLIFHARHYMNIPNYVDTQKSIEKLIITDKEETVFTRDRYHDVLKETVETFPDAVHILQRLAVYILHEAIEHNNRELIMLLIKNGADLSLRNQREETALSLLMKLSNSTDFVESIFDSRVEFSCDFTNRCTSVVRFDYKMLAPKINDDHDKGQMRILKAFLETGDYKGQRRLLVHPLIESFVYRKWQAYAKYFWFIILLYVSCVVSLSVYIVTTFYYKDLLAEAKRVPDKQLATSPIFWNPHVCRSIIYVTLGFVFTQELSFIHDLARNWLKYRPPAKKLIECVIKCLSFILAISTPLLLTIESEDNEWLRFLAILTLVLAWSNIMMLLAKTPLTGYYIHMFWNVSLKIFKILLTFSSLIIMFSFCFMIQFHTQVPFDGPFAAIVKTLAMLTSEFDYKDNYSQMEPSFHWFTVFMLRFVFVIFVIFTAIVLMNLMTSVAVSDVQDLIHKGNMRRIENQIELLYALEVSRKNKTCFHILGLQTWLKCNNVLKGEQLTPSVFDYESQYNENIREILRNKVQEKMQKEIIEKESSFLKTTLSEVFKATKKNEQSMIKNTSNFATEFENFTKNVLKYETKIDQILQDRKTHETTIIKIESKLDEALQATMKNEQKITSNETKFDRMLMDTAKIVLNNKSRLDEIFQTTMKNEQSVIKIESKLDEILQAITLMKQNQKQL